MGFLEITQLPTRHVIKSSFESSAFQMRYRSMTTVSMDLNCYIIQFSPLTAAEKSSGTNQRKRQIIVNHDNYHEYRTRQFDPAFQRHPIQ